MPPLATLLLEAAVKNAFRNCALSQFFSTSIEVHYDDCQ